MNAKINTNNYKIQKISNYLRTGNAQTKFGTTTFQTSIM